MKIINYRRPSYAIRRTDPGTVRRYLRYWKSLAPDCHERYYRAWQFAFLSVHTTWEVNVRSFVGVRALGLDFTRRRLRTALERSGVGLYNVRERGLWQFHQDFWARPAAWYPAPGESVRDCRDRLLPAVYGLHLAKLSFAMELAFPEACDAVCLDVHLLRLYGIEAPGRPCPSAYRDIESHWAGRCAARGLPSPMVRHAYWDSLQNQGDTRYWSWVFEPEPSPETPAITGESHGQTKRIR